MITVQERLALAPRPTGFDYLRLALATGVIAQHTVNISYGQAAAAAMFVGPNRAIWGLILPMFFALSGFLVTGSFERSRSLVSFMGLRAIRLVPALMFEVTMSALILGPIFTSFSIHGYFSAPEFFRYFLNIVGRIHYTLPGVFLNNPDPQLVNGQLWTIPIELKCYIILGILGLLGIVGRLSFTVWLMIATQIALSAGALYFGGGNSGLTPSFVLIGCFLVGVCAYRLRAIIPLSGTAAAIATATSLLILTNPAADWFLPIPLCYMTIYIGTLNPPRIPLVLSGDYSYGLYLYGFPVQQAVATMAWTHDWRINLVIAYPIAFTLAVVSWWMVEKPAAKLKHLIYYVENQVLKLRVVRWHSSQVFAVSTPGRQNL